jgi:hypothetical protein
MDTRECTQEQQVLQKYSQWCQNYCTCMRTTSPSHGYFLSWRPVGGQYYCRLSSAV